MANGSRFIRMVSVEMKRKSSFKDRMVAFGGKAHDLEFHQNLFWAKRQDFSMLCGI